MGFLLGSKPEHETLCFSVWSGCSRRWKVPPACGGCGWGRFIRELVPPPCSATSGCFCVRSSIRFLNLWLHGYCCNGRMNVAWAFFWGVSWSTKPCIFPCKAAAAGDEKGTSCAQWLRLGSFHPRIGSSSQLSGLGTPSKGISSAMAGQNEKL